MRGGAACAEGRRARRGGVRGLPPERTERVGCVDGGYWRGEEAKGGAAVQRSGGGTGTAAGQGRGRSGRAGGTDIGGDWIGVDGEGGLRKGEGGSLVSRGAPHFSCGGPGARGRGLVRRWGAAGRANFPRRTAKTPASPQKPPGGRQACGRPAAGTGMAGAFGTVHGVGGGGCEGDSLVEGGGEMEFCGRCEREQ